MKNLILLSVALFTILPVCASAQIPKPLESLEVQTGHGVIPEPEEYSALFDTGLYFGYDSYGHQVVIDDTGKCRLRLPIDFILMRKTIGIKGQPYMVARNRLSGVYIAIDKPADPNSSIAEIVATGFSYKDLRRQIRQRNRLTEDISAIKVDEKKLDAIEPTFEEEISLIMESRVMVGVAKELNCYFIDSQYFWDIRVVNPDQEQSFWFRGFPGVEHKVSSGEAMTLMLNESDCVAVYRRCYSDGRTQFFLKYSDLCY